jgi:hypothetical protein
VPWASGRTSTAAGAAPTATHSVASADNAFAAVWTASRNGAVSAAAAPVSSGTSSGGDGTRIAAVNTQSR